MKFYLNFSLRLPIKIIYLYLYLKKVVLEFQKILHKHV